jgi:hypothetical protein
LIGLGADDRRALGLGGFGCRASFYDLASRREFGDQAAGDNADAFHAKQHGASNVREAGEEHQGFGNECRDHGN